MPLHSTSRGGITLRCPFEDSPVSHRQSDSSVMPIVSDFSGCESYGRGIMRPLAIFLAALVMALSPPAVLAKPDTPPGQAAKPGQADPPGQAKKEDKPEPPGQGSAADQDEAQRAVETHEALPLARIVAVAETRSAGHVINARLVRVDGVLLYQLTLLDEDGRSWREYYHARTGHPVVIR